METAQVLAQEVVVIHVVEVVKAVAGKTVEELTDMIAQIVAIKNTGGNKV